MDLDEMTFETRVKNSLKEGGIWAYDVSIDLVGEKNKIVFNLLAPDAVIYARFRAGETFFDKPEEIARLKSFGVDLKNWRELKVVTSGNHIKFLLEEDLIFATDYEGNLGKLTGIQLYFKGSGAADFV